ncbi:hypothetical protein A3C28_01835 [Candidatus Roizmanbacteria bacterium RIFCSPHIGHO2_02_FULL_39_9]|uniref:Uncharacterized protein n=2 Tax=Candidatus Roizmaniibacteriota TaxID=1752723 RepID=A0A1F7HV16_9BACT|nr:MAG: hypothetical protein A3C28_01835 [Candidatus Roizmanbacteria bacterium RIFCSPHIGHO2_02_FULL_39_9]OGK34866.1 MAG: hypothetical protein A3F60_05160 [Candidatus Roizmanbacteria bacterium RIFCSPHIGHO2_12_FULL_39_8]
MLTITPFIVDPTTFPPAQVATIANLLNVIIPLLNIGAALLLLLMLLYGAFTWITAGGNPENLKRAQKIITFAVFGLFIVLLSYLGVKLITIIFNINVPI